MKSARMRGTERPHTPGVRWAPIALHLVVRIPSWHTTGSASSASRMVGHRRGGCGAADRLGLDGEGSK
jgi:hypothetical protein